MDSLRGEVDSLMLRANAAVLTLPMFQSAPRFRRTTKTRRSATHELAPTQPRQFAFGNRQGCLA